jgi:hypothetical protein
MAHMDCTRSVSCIILLGSSSTVYIVVYVVVEGAVYCISITSVILVIGHSKYVPCIYFYESAIAHQLFLLLATKNISLVYTFINSIHVTCCT